MAEENKKKYLQTKPNSQTEETNDSPIQYTHEY